MHSLWRVNTVFWALAYGLLLLGLPSPGLAAGNMDFSGTLIATPECTVSDQNSPIRVAFGSLHVDKIDGERYRQPIPYQIKCPGLQLSQQTWKMRLTFMGTPAAFNKNLLSTSIDGLAIKLLLEGRELAVKQQQEISLDSLKTPPAFEAVPVRESGSQLPIRTFSASGLLLVELY